ncbi:unnamed protein product [Ostreobium quekettii]|uniref:Uncharacterized protein n=1 Tax=Ostreobium quekettii TaxID=121088 RepID=A0A8S1IX99_9CHLO|nr:unnamed protein product [Ostreobium quekettii]
MVWHKGLVAQKRQRPSLADNCVQEQPVAGDNEIVALGNRVPSDVADSGGTLGPVEMPEGSNRAMQFHRNCDLGSASKVGRGEDRSQTVVEEMPSGSDDADPRSRKALRTISGNSAGVTALAGGRLFAGSWDTAEVSPSFNIVRGDEVKETNLRKEVALDTQQLWTNHHINSSEESCVASRVHLTEEHTYGAARAVVDGQAPVGHQASIHLALGGHRVSPFPAVSEAVNEEHQPGMQADVSKWSDVSLLKDGVLPNVDVTRIVDLPQEFGSLKVRFRITAGECACCPACDSSTLHGGDMKSGSLWQQLGEGDESLVFDPQTDMQHRLTMAGQFLSTLQRYENAHMKLGRIPSACDMHAMEAALAQHRKHHRSQVSAKDLSSLGGATEVPGHRSSSSGIGSPWRRCLSVTSSGSLRHTALNMTVPEEAQPSSRAHEALRDERKTTGVMEPKNKHKILGATEPRTLSVVERERGTRNVVLFPTQDLEAQGALQGFVFTGAVQTSSCLVLQIPPASKAPIGGSSKQEYSPVYCPAQLSLDGLSATASPKVCKGKAQVMSSMPPAKCAEMREPSAGNCEPQQDEPEPQSAAVPFTALHSGTEMCDREYIDVVVQPMLELHAAELPGACSISPHENNVNRQRGKEKLEGGDPPPCYDDEQIIAGGFGGVVC